MGGRTFAIGDIHGCSIALRALREAVSPQPEDTVVTLGDYVDRGIDSKGVLDQLIELERCCHLVPLLGNHEEMMLNARQGRLQLEFWLACGGTSALASYEDERLSSVPPEHWQFLDKCKSYHQTEKHFFVHANYEPQQTLEEQGIRHLRWLSLRDFVPGPHVSGRAAVVGHTPQADGEILDLGYLKCIDTNCWQDGWLTALEVESGRVWQANERGKVRFD